jgi:hypothetical protein
MHQTTYGINLYNQRKNSTSELATSGFLTNSLKTKIGKTVNLEKMPRRLLVDKSPGSIKPLAATLVKMLHAPT